MSLSFFVQSWLQKYPGGRSGGSAPSGLNLDAAVFRKARIQMGGICVAKVQREDIGMREIETRGVHRSSLICGGSIKGHEGGFVTGCVGGEQLGVEVRHVPAWAPIFAATQS